jgi:hypothetical protein
MSLASPTLQSNCNGGTRNISLSLLATHPRPPAPRRENASASVSTGETVSAAIDEVLAPAKHLTHNKPACDGANCR